MIILSKNASAPPAPATGRAAFYLDTNGRPRLRQSNGDDAAVRGGALNLAVATAQSFTAGVETLVNSAWGAPAGDDAARFASGVWTPAAGRTYAIGVMILLDPIGAGGSTMRLEAAVGGAINFDISRGLETYQGGAAASMLTLHAIYRATGSETVRLYLTAAANSLTFVDSRYGYMTMVEIAPAP